MRYFEHFCPDHIFMLVLITAVIVTGLFFAQKLSSSGFDKLARILSLSVLAGEILQDILLIRDGGNFIEFLPLHLCNLGIFVNIIASFTRGKISSFFAEISLVLIMPGALGALLFPDWNYRPFWSYLPLLCFLTHTLLLFIPLLFFTKKRSRVSFRHFWYSFLFLAVVVPPLYLFDKKAGTNYLFLMYPPKSSPLEWVLHITGDKLYLFGVFVLLTLVLALEYALYSGLQKIFRK